MERMEMTQKEFQSFIARSFNEGIRTGRFLDELRGKTKWKVI